MLKKNQEELELLLDNYTKKDLVVAFSGGVDSSLLLKIACEKAMNNHTKVYAVTIHTKLHPMKDIEIATRVAKEMGAIHQIIKVDELNEADILDNPVDRCYRCKKTLFKKVIEKAKEWNVEQIIEGTNEDDLHMYRPGIKALSELNIKSPLAQAKLTKAQVRELANKYQISVSNRPSNPCLATRLPYNTRLSEEVMNRIDRAEQAIRELGFYNVRVRAHEGIARVEVDNEDFPQLLMKRTKIIEMIKAQGFSYVTLDLEGFRSGSMDIHLSNNRNPLGYE